MTFSSLSPSSPTPLPAISHETVSLSGIDLHVAIAGDADAPLVLMLHGFPEFWGAWRRAIGPLVAAGWRVVVPDQRGYAASSKPRGIAAYALDVLADDVVGIAMRLGARRFALVGHDWGGIVAWHVAARNAAAVERLIILNAPHPCSLAPYALTHPGQMLRSMYVGFFQLPAVPEAVLGANDFALLAGALTQSSRRGTFSDAELTEYRRAWAVPEALRAMIDWYRAMPVSTPTTQKITAPVRILWGDADTALQPGLAEAALRYCEEGEAIHLLGASHWLHHEEPEKVHTRLNEFLGVSALLREHQGKFAP
jgi:pimeloyl-ACP methyl ester carboxylesterase